mmetsp:Transcript_51531/g.84811  ORF Transcript_51531/g.84811 Transcript_51531/m.84811 type:complete len:81 (-) Transcript_51531:1389-1631(-)
MQERERQRTHNSILLNISNTEGQETTLELRICKPSKQNKKPINISQNSIPGRGEAATMNESMNHPGPPQQLVAYLTTIQI